MDFFLSGTFWFIEGILFTIILISFNVWAKDNKITLSPIKWTAFVLWIFFLGFTIAFVTTSYGEGEPTAGFKGGILFGMITLISGAGILRFILSGKAKA